MKNILGVEGLRFLRQFVNSNTLFAFDLDGTLAPIISEPSEVRLEAALADSMRQLSLLAKTAVITGRSCDDARHRLGFNPDYLAGNHGLEGLPGEQPDQHKKLQLQVKEWLGQLDELLEPETRQMMRIENKGFSIALHYRQATDSAAVHTAILSAIDRLEPLPRRVGGKFVENLVPAGTPDKGDAILRLIEHSGCSTAMFMGDDETDEDVFRLSDKRILSVFVGTAGTEVVTAADYFVDKQEKSGLLVNELIKILRGT